MPKKFEAHLTKNLGGVGSHIDKTLTFIGIDFQFNINVYIVFFLIFASIDQIILLLHIYLCFIFYIFTLLLHLLFELIFLLLDLHTYFHNYTFIPSFENFDNDPVVYACDHSVYKQLWREESHYTQMGMKCCGLCTFTITDPCSNTLLFYRAYILH